MNPADEIVNGYFGKTKQTASQNEADSIVSGYFSRKSSSPHPLDDSFLTKAEKDTGDQSYNNYCEQFVEQVAYGNNGLYPSAQAAWNAYVRQGKAVKGNVEDAPRGAMLYFQGDNSNRGFGHAGFADGRGGLISATSSGVKTIPISQWISQTKQKPLGYVLPTK